MTEAARRPFQSKSDGERPLIPTDTVGTIAKLLHPTKSQRSDGESRLAVAKGLALFTVDRHSRKVVNHAIDRVSEVSPSVAEPLRAIFEETYKAINPPENG